MGDAAVPGAGAYVDSAIGGAAATGDGDVMMRFSPSFHAVQEMANGVHVRSDASLIFSMSFASFPGQTVPS